MGNKHRLFQESHLRHSKDFAFLDTDLINYVIWERLVFGKELRSFEKAAMEEDDHVYLITYPDIPWEADPLRENPENREEIFELHKAEIEKTGRPYKVITGIKEKRLECAIQASLKLISLAKL